MTSHRPYLLRALIEWVNDNEMTPHLLVDDAVAGVQVPVSAIKNGRVVLNVAERAVANLHIDNDCVSFSARFSGVVSSVCVPIAAVLAVYARETGQGMVLPDDFPAAQDTSSTQPTANDAQQTRSSSSNGDIEDPTPPQHSEKKFPSGSKHAHLRVIK